MAVSYDDFAALALALPGVTEKAGRYEIDLFRDGRHMARLREKGTVIAVRMFWEEIDRLLESQSHVFFVTPHYQGWPYLLAKLDDLDLPLAQRLVTASYEAAPVQIAKRAT